MPRHAGWEATGDCAPSSPPWRDDSSVINFSRWMRSGQCLVRRRAHRRARSSFVPILAGTRGGWGQLGEWEGSWGRRVPYGGAGQGAGGRPEVLRPATACSPDPELSTGAAIYGCL